MYSGTRSFLDLAQAIEFDNQETTRLAQPDKHSETSNIHWLNYYSNLSNPLEPGDHETKELSSSIFNLGSVLVKDLSYLLDSFSYDANHLRDYESNPKQVTTGDLSPELTRNFWWLKVWFTLKNYGIEPFKAALEERSLLAQYFYTKIEKTDSIQTACTPALSIVTFRSIPKIADSVNQFNTSLIEAIQSIGKAFLSSTLINQNIYLRKDCQSFRHHLEHVQLALKIITNKIKLLYTSCYY